MRASRQPARPSALCHSTRAAQAAAEGAAAADAALAAARAAAAAAERRAEARGAEAADAAGTAEEALRASEALAAELDDARRREEALQVLGGWGRLKIRLGSPQAPLASSPCWTRHWRPSWTTRGDARRRCRCLAAGISAGVGQGNPSRVLPRPPRWERRAAAAGAAACLARHSAAAAPLLELACVLREARRLRCSCPRGLATAGCRHAPAGQHDSLASGQRHAGTTDRCFCSGSFTSATGELRPPVATSPGLDQARTQAQRQPLWRLMVQAGSVALRAGRRRRIRRWRSA